MVGPAQSASSTALGVPALAPRNRLRSPSQRGPQVVRENLAAAKLSTYPPQSTSTLGGRAIDTGSVLFSIIPEWRLSLGGYQLSPAPEGAWPAPRRHPPSQITIAEIYFGPLDFRRLLEPAHCHSFHGSGTPLIRYATSLLRQPSRPSLTGAGSKPRRDEVNETQLEVRDLIRGRL